MATLVTVSCDRCGSIIPEVVANGVRLIGTIAAHLDRSYEGIARSEWQLCASCYEHVTERIGDIAGVPSEDWRRPPETMAADKEQALRVLERSRVTYRDIELGPVSDPIAEARLIIDGEGPE